MRVSRVAMERQAACKSPAGKTTGQLPPSFIGLIRGLTMRRLHRLRRRLSFPGQSRSGQICVLKPRQQRVKFLVFPVADPLAFQFLETHDEPVIVGRLDAPISHGKEDPVFLVDMPAEQAYVFSRRLGHLKRCGFPAPSALCSPSMPKAGNKNSSSLA